jgi:8-oxo-dGTP pyrophosphatase MutT (NUDIX family)
VSKDDRQPVPDAWEILESDELYRNPYFVFRKDTCALPNARIMPAYYVWELVDWVNVIALTPDHRLILVNQYRHAAGKRFYEFPGGTTDPGRDENPEEAARRELLEETGYASKRLQYLGMHYPNPGLQDNRLHVYLAADCEQVCEQKLDTFEDIVVELVDVQQLLQVIEQGYPMHSLMMASLTLALPAIKRLYSNSFAAI